MRVTCTYVKTRSAHTDIITKIHAFMLHPEVRIASMYSYRHADTHTHTQRHMYIYIYICVYIHIYIYIYPYAHRELHARELQTRLTKTCMLDCEYMFAGMQKS